MRKIILASHGNLAEGMYSALKMIAGDIDNILVFGLEQGNHPASITNEITKIIEKDNEFDYVIITDLFGGSINNNLMSLCSYDNVYIISGMNLSLILEISQSDPTVKTKDLISDAVSMAKEGLLYVNSLITEFTTGEGH